MKTVLVIDDDKIIRDYCEALLEMFPVNVLTADDGDAGIKIMEEHPEVDLIILELEMKRINGWQAYPRLKGIKHDVKVLVSSSYIYDGTERKLKEMGVDAVLRRPFHPIGFGVIVKDLLGL